MGVEYERWLIARGNAFSPGAAAVVKLVERLRKEQWIVDPASPDLAKFRFVGKRNERAQKTGGYAVKTVENTFGNDLAAKLVASTERMPALLTTTFLDDSEREELRLVWPVAGADPLPLKYPLSRKPDGEVSYAIEVHRALEYVYPISETIGPVPSVCRCGEDLSFEWDDEELVPAFGASTGIFAECEACSRTFEPSKGTAEITDPFDGTKKDVAGGAAYRFALKVDCGKCFVPGATFASELVALVESEFGREFYEVGTVY
jgi:hypothetical protein